MTPLEANAPWMSEMEEAVLRVMRSGRYIGGEEVVKFEEELAAFIGTRYAVGVSNGLDALRLILLAYKELGRLKDGDEVIVPANTYIATVLAITHAGLTPVLAEPSTCTLNLDLERLEEYVTPRTRAIMNVHLYGRANWSLGLERLAEKRGLLLLEDNAQAIGACWRAVGADPFRRTGSLGHAAAFSFYPTKNVGAMGDAGAVTTNDEMLASTVRALANYGADRRYHNIYTGFNCRLDPIQAAILRVKLPHTDEINERRREAARRWDAMLLPPDISRMNLLNGRDEDGINYYFDLKKEGIEVTIPEKPLYPEEHVWHQYVVLTPQRERFQRFLAARGLSWDIHYATPPHLQPCYTRMPDAQLHHAPLPITERLASQCLSLPL